MSLVIRYRCHGCGAFHDGARGPAWVRCSYCQALIGFDLLAWVESPEYGAWLKRAAQLAPGFAEYQKAADAGAKAARKGKLEDAEHHLRDAVTRLMALTPHNYPPEVQRDAAYRERYLRFEAKTRLLMQVDPELAAIDAELQQVCRALDYRDPMPTLEKALALLRREMDALAKRAGLADPDNLPPESRARVTLSGFVGAYLPMLTPAQRVEVLRKVHGASNVVEAGARGGDELGPYLDWQCPCCGLASLQARAGVELLCPGCYHRRPLDAAALKLPALSLKCASCGDSVSLAEGAVEACCGSCGTVVLRMVRTGTAERELTRAALEGSGAAAALAAMPGVEVTAANRLELVLTGLARQANWYSLAVQPSRYVEVVRRSLPESSDAQRAVKLARVAELSAAEGGNAEAQKLIEKARALLGG